MEGDDVFYVSEHRKSYDNTKELPNIIHNTADITLFPISITRFACYEAAEILAKAGVKINIINQLWIKPFILHEDWKRAIVNSKHGGIVLDDDYEEGAASSIAHRIMLESSRRVETLCLKHRTAGFYPTVDNLPPNAEEIVAKVLQIIKSS
jgi:deoxyxylulose-5-phosphate synthase